MQGIILISRQLHTQKWQTLTPEIFYIYIFNNGHISFPLFSSETQRSFVNHLKVIKLKSVGKLVILCKMHMLPMQFTGASKLYTKQYQLYFNAVFNLALSTRARFINPLCNFLSLNNIQLVVVS